MTAAPMPIRLPALARPEFSKGAVAQNPEFRGYKENQKKGAIQQARPGPPRTPLNPERWVAQRPKKWSLIPNNQLALPLTPSESDKSGRESMLPSQSCVLAQKLLWAFNP